MATGGEGSCPCTNATTALSSLAARSCRLSSGDNGVQLNTRGGACVPFSYGSFRCRQHDLLYDPSCQVNEADERVIPAYCFRPFCFVDADTCIRESEQRVYRSAYFPPESGVDVFYSYSVCNATAEDWLAVEDDIMGNRAMNGATLEATVPTYLPLLVFKTDGNGDSLSSPGSEYYNNSVPYKGVYIDYMKQLMEISQGDIRNVTYSHRSRVSSVLHPESRFTAAVQDVQDGLFDMAVGPFWITGKQICSAHTICFHLSISCLGSLIYCLRLCIWSGQRLKMTAFSLPIVYDKTFLVILKPGASESLWHQVRKVLMPLSTDLWGVVIGIIVITALLSVWFSDRSDKAMNGRVGRMGLQHDGQRVQRRKLVYTRLALDSCLQKGLFFCSAGVEHDEGGTLSNHLLMFGFAFFILIAVSAYVANLAAFLTLTLSSSAGETTIEGAVAAGYTICAHIAIKDALRVAWPKAIFHFHEDGNEYHGILDDYLAGKCKVLAIGHQSTELDSRILQRFCSSDLVRTDSLILETPIAFPVRKELTAGLSYWMLEAEKYHGLSIEKLKEELPLEITCDLDYSVEDIEASEYAAVTTKNMSLPLIFFFTCAIIAILLQIVHQRRLKRGQESLIGRRSTLELVEDSLPGRQNPLVSLTASSRLNPISSLIRRNNLGSNSDPKEDANEIGDCDGFHHRISEAKSIAKGIIEVDDDFMESGVQQPRVRWETFTS
ncbi:hypothetical protein ACHAWF_005534 [Thalassiosira exigua]